MPSSTSNSEKGTKKRKLASSRKSNPSKPSKKKLPAGIPVANLGHLKPRDAPSLAPETIERVVSRNRMAKQGPATSQALKRLSQLQLQDPEKIKELIEGMGLEDPKAEIEKTKQARLKAKHLEEVKRRSALIFEKKSGLSKSAKAAHLKAVTAEQEQRAKLQKTARVSAEKESARQIAQIAKLKAELPPGYKGPVYTNRQLLRLSTIKEEGRKKKGSKKGKKEKKGKLGHRNKKKLN